MKCKAKDAYALCGVKIECYWHLYADVFLHDKLFS